jgi:hypothetical protein
MLLTIAAILLVLWIAGFAMSVLGGFVHILLILAIVVAAAHFFRGAGRRVA